MSSEPEYAGTNRATGTGANVPLFADVEETLISMQEVVGRKWHPVIVYHLLEDGPLGFGLLKEQVDGISSKMLSDSLDTLESAGLVTRTVISDRPVRVEYDLTDRGAALEPLVTEMIDWGTEHAAALETQSADEKSGDAPVGAHAEGG
jgi:DNA-binding HxlR family transcriptional regulator